MATLEAVRIPALERLVLAELAYRNGETESETLTRLVRDAAVRTLLMQDAQRTLPALGNQVGSAA